MGQGTESCGGYEVEYDPYEDGLSDGIWMQSNGSGIHVSKMSLRHLKNAQKLAQNMANQSTFYNEIEKWEAWVDIFEYAIDDYKETPAKPNASPKQKPRGKKTRMRCHCGSEYDARNADLARGWALSCSKSCAAIRRDFGRPKAKKVDG